MVSRILILGGGFIARTHAETARLLPDRPEVCVADIDPLVLAKFQQDFPEVTGFADPGEMLAQPLKGTEIAIIATPPWLHHRQSLDALASGRHVLCEKPFATSTAELDEVWSQSKKRKLHIACCSVRYLNRPVLAAVQVLVDGDSLGRPLHVRWQARMRASRPGIEYQPTSRWFLEKSKAGAGCLFDWGPYDIATFNALFSPSKVIVESAWTTRPERGPLLPDGVICDVEHQVCATLKYVQADGQTVRIDYERMATCFGPPTESYQIEGPHGAIDWDWLEWKGDTVRVYRDRNGEDETSATRFPDEPGDEGMRRPLRTFVDFLNGKPTSLLNDKQAWFNFRILCAIQDAAVSGKPQTVKFPR